MTRATAHLLAASATALAVACGGAERQPPADHDGVREVEVLMTDFRFTLSDTVFVAGETYRFILRNGGFEAHEWAVVPRGAVDEEDLLIEVEEDELPPGATHVLEYTFSEPGEYDFACFLPGHYEAGMVVPIRVVASADGIASASR